MFCMVSRDGNVTNSWSFELNRVQYSFSSFHAEHAKKLHFSGPKIEVVDKKEEISVKACKHPLQLDQFKILSHWLVGLVGLNCLICSGCPVLLCVSGVVSSRRVGTLRGSREYQNLLRENWHKMDTKSINNSTSVSVN